MQQNKPLKDEVKDVFSYLKKTKKGVINNEVIIDVAQQDVRFIYYFSQPQKQNFYKLRAVYLREKYRRYTNKELPIFCYKLGKVKCLKHKKIEEFHAISAFMHQNHPFLMVLKEF